MSRRIERTPQELFHSRLAQEDGRRCYLAHESRARLMYGPCDGRIQAHHLIPQRVLRREHARGRFPGVPLSALLSDYRNGILVCEKHHHLLDQRRVVPMLLDLPERLFGFLGQFDLWATAGLLYVRPEGHSDGHGRNYANSGHGPS